MRTHGLASSYRAGGCRCEECCAANTERARRDRASRAARLAADPSLATHGSAMTYLNWRCRCEKCVQAHSARMAAQRDQRKATGSGALPASYYKEAV